jgi:hypothetical protein
VWEYSLLFDSCSLCCDREDYRNWDIKDIKDEKDLKALRFMSAIGGKSFSNQSVLVRIAGHVRQQLLTMNYVLSTINTIIIVLI